MVRGLQDLVHIPLMACILPSRLLFFMAQIVPIVKLAVPSSKAKLELVSIPTVPLVALVRLIVRFPIPPEPGASTPETLIPPMTVGAIVPVPPRDPPVTLMAADELLMIAPELIRNVLAPPTVIAWFVAEEPPASTTVPLPLIVVPNV